MTLNLSPNRLARLAGLVLCVVLAHDALAQTAPARTTRQRQPVAAASPAPEKAPVAAAEWRFGPEPAWVAGPPPDSVPSEPARAGAPRQRRDLLLDQQWHIGDTGIQAYWHSRSVALDQGALRGVSEPQIAYNPDYQRVVIHNLSLIRGGQRLDRTKDMRVEVLRREQSLEQRVITGQKALLLIPSDVRVGDIVELAYTIEGWNPIFENRLSMLLTFGLDWPVDVARIRVDAPRERRFQTRALASDLVMQTTDHGARQVLEGIRRNLAGTTPEHQTPPWHKVYPAVLITDYANWTEVDAWAQRLFAPTPGDPSVARLAEQFRARQLPPADTVAAVLRFVQDEVRYFSVSLGESSHRPKSPAQTLADRMGDCKDKVMLFNAVLAELGITARPALVSVARNRAILDYLPGPSEFDHVVSQVEVDGRRLLLDPTLPQQGLSLRNQGHPRYGAAFVVGQGRPPEPYVPPPDAVDEVISTQTWDLSDLRRQRWPLRLQLQARGLTAEAWRAGLSAGALERWSQVIGGTYVKAYPGLSVAGAPVVQDDRNTNTIAVQLAFDWTGPTQYRRGSVRFEYVPLDILELLELPPEARRSMPYWLTQPQAVEQRIFIQTPRPLPGQPPGPRQLGDRHLSIATRYDVRGQELRYTTRLERRSDAVEARDVNAYRERLMEARRQLGQTVGLPLVDFDALDPQLGPLQRRLEAQIGKRDDQLRRQVMADEVTDVVATAALAQVHGQSLLAAHILVDRAEALNQLTRFDEGLASADAALAILPEHGPAHTGRGVALMGLTRYADAVAAFEAAARAPQGNTADYWLGLAQLYADQPERAARTLRDYHRDASGPARDFAGIWLYLVTERLRPGEGRTLFSEDDLSDSSGAGFGRQLLRHVTGRIDQDSLLAQARKSESMERMNLAEAYFFIGQLLVARGQRQEAAGWFEKVLETRALPYREFSLAQGELRRRP